jgi:hypothetical protein
VEVEKVCYDDGEESIVVTFTNCSPDALDWIGIYHIDSDPGKGNYLLWTYTCGTQHCTTPYKSTSVYFDEWESDLDEGKYIVYLHSDNSVDVKATSRAFYIKDHC